MRTYLIAGNWKMNTSSREAMDLLVPLKEGVVSYPDVEWAVFPPYPYLSEISSFLEESPIQCGAQSVSSHALGAFTGEVSAVMLADVGCQYVIVGHSEQRAYFNVSNQQVATQVNMCLQYGLKPIVCLGETLEQRQAKKTLQIVQEQLAVVLSLQDNPLALVDTVIAYEPVWAIGTGLQATPEQAQEVHAAIRAQLAAVSEELAERMRIIYGGSVKPDGASALFAMPDIDGALVGGASLDAQQFLQIGMQCNK